MSVATMKRPPRTMMQVFKSLPEGTLIQLIENNLVMSPAPTDSHQKTLGKLFIALTNFVNHHDLGETRFAPYDLYLDRKNAFQPDLFFISKERLHLIKKDGLHGAPDLVIEILSPSTANYDQQQKKNVYERCGVKEYWIIDPETRIAQGFHITDQYFEALPEEEGVIRSPLLGASFHF